MTSKTLSHNGRRHGPQRQRTTAPFRQRPQGDLVLLRDVTHDDSHCVDVVGSQFCTTRHQQICDCNPRSARTRTSVVVTAQPAQYQRCVCSHVVAVVSSALVGIGPQQQQPIRIKPALVYCIGVLELSLNRYWDRILVPKP